MKKKKDTNSEDDDSDNEEVEKEMKAYQQVRIGGYDGSKWG